MGHTCWTRSHSRGMRDEASYKSILRDRVIESLRRKPQPPIRPVKETDSQIVPYHSRNASSESEKTIFVIPNSIESPKSPKCNVKLLDLEMLELEKRDLAHREARHLESYRDMEERMIRFERECEGRFRQELESQLRRMRTVELNSIRLQEQDRARVDNEKYRGNLDRMHQERLERLHQIEISSMAKIRAREQALEAKVSESKHDIEAKFASLQAREEDLIRKQEATERDRRTAKKGLDDREDFLKDREENMEMRIAEERAKCEKLILNSRREAHDELKNEFARLHENQAQFLKDRAKFEGEKEALERRAREGAQYENELKVLRESERQNRVRLADCAQTLSETREQLRAVNDTVSRLQLDNARLSALVTSEEKKSRMMEDLLEQSKATHRQTADDLARDRFAIHSSDHSKIALLETQLLQSKERLAEEQEENKRLHSSLQTLRTEKAALEVALKSNSGSHSDKAFFEKSIRSQVEFEIASKQISKMEAEANENVRKIEEYKAKLSDAEKQLDAARAVHKTEVSALIKKVSDLQKQVQILKLMDGLDGNLETIIPSSSTAAQNKMIKPSSTFNNHRAECQMLDSRLEEFLKKIDNQQRQVGDSLSSVDDSDSLSFIDTEDRMDQRGEERNLQNRNDLRRVRTLTDSEEQDRYAINSNQNNSMLKKAHGRPSHYAVSTMVTKCQPCASVNRSPIRHRNNQSPCSSPMGMKKGNLTLVPRRMTLPHNVHSKMLDSSMGLNQAESVLHNSMSPADDWANDLTVMSRRNDISSSPAPGILSRQSTNNLNNNIRSKIPGQVTYNNMNDNNNFMANTNLNFRSNNLNRSDTSEIGFGLEGSFRDENNLFNENHFTGSTNLNQGNLTSQSNFNNFQNVPSSFESNNQNDNYLKSQNPSSPHKESMFPSSHINPQTPGSAMRRASVIVGSNMAANMSTGTLNNNPNLPQNSNIFENQSSTPAANVFSSQAMFGDRSLNNQTPTSFDHHVNENNNLNNANATARTPQSVLITTYTPTLSNSNAILGVADFSHLPNNANNNPSLNSHSNAINNPNSASNAYYGSHVKTASQSVTVTDNTINYNEGFNNINNQNPNSSNAYSVSNIANTATPFPFISNQMPSPLMTSSLPPTSPLFLNNSKNPLLSNTRPPLLLQTDQDHTIIGQNLSAENTVTGSKSALMHLVNSQTRDVGGGSPAASPTMSSPTANHLNSIANVLPPFSKTGNTTNSPDNVLLRQKNAFSNLQNLQKQLSPSKKPPLPSASPTNLSVNDDGSHASNRRNLQQPPTSAKNLTSTPNFMDSSSSSSSSSSSEKKEKEEKEREEVEEATYDSVVENVSSLLSDAAIMEQKGPRTGLAERTKRFYNEIAAVYLDVLDTFGGDGKLVERLTSVLTRYLNKQSYPGTI
eukprot:GDKK01047451.1.p1 GENE.GDKK01047451.1~~GDKK01047451.1.p1  ORF type:complete len:1393 (-),score=332.08 GDKK01047451.1:3361-7539(-)